MQKYDIVDYDYLKIILKDYTILNHHKNRLSIDKTAKSDT